MSTTPVVEGAGNRDERMPALRDSYDVVIVGARCAGAFTAMLLARAGLSVLAIDWSQYGSDALSTHALMRGGVLQLHRWGLLDRLKATSTPPITRTSFHYGDEVVTVPIKPRDGVDALYAPRRTVLDPLLVDAAVEAGATVVHGTRLLELRRSPAGRVNGVAIRQGTGDVKVVGAELVVGADGLNSTVARLAGAAVTHAGRHATGVLYGYWSGMTVDGNHWYYRTDVSVGAIPTTDGLTCLFVALPEREFMAAARFDREASHARALAAAAPDLFPMLARGARVGPLRGFAGERGFIKRPHGPGWALVGDAGYFRDPITAHGITDALRDAELLSRAVVRGGDAAFADYEATRDEFAIGLFGASDDVASFEWDLPRVQAIHKFMSEEMNREVRMLLELDHQQRAAPALSTAQ